MPNNSYERSLSALDRRNRLTGDEARSYRNARLDSLVQLLEMEYLRSPVLDGENPPQTSQWLSNRVAAEILLACGSLSADEAHSFLASQVLPVIDSFAWFRTKPRHRDVSEAFRAFATRFKL